MANDPLGTVQPGTAPSVQSPQLQRNLQDPDYLFYNLLNSGKFSQAGKEHYEKRRREKLVEQVGYEPTFWENPTRVARYYNAIQNAPTDWKKPDWLDPEAVKTAYDYYKFRNEDKPWYTWKYLPTDDPGRAYMQSLGQPPDDPEYILDQYLGGLPLQEYEQPAIPDEPTTAETLTSTWKDLPDWQKFFLTIGMPTGGIEGRPELSRFAAAGAQGGLAAMGGAAIGSALLPGVGTVVGALALGVPTGIMSYFGSPYVPVLSDLLNIFNVPAMAAMQTLGVGKQVVGSITDAERFGSFSELLNDMPEAWSAAKTTYMTQPNWLFDIAAELTGDEAAGPGKVWQFQKGIIEPVAVDDIRTDALVDYRRRMAAGENEADLYSEYVDKYGFSGTFNDFLYQSVFDPLQLSPYVSSRLGTKITGAIGKQTGNLGIQRLSKTFEAGQGSLLVDLMPMGLNYAVGKLTGKVGSQGLIDTWRTYQNNIRRNFPTAGIEPRPPSELSAFEKFAANLTPEGRYKELEPRVQRKGLAGWKDYLTNLTNDSKARLFLFGMHDNLGALLNEAKGDPVRMNKLIDLVSQPEPADVGEAAAGLINSPMAATIQAAVREVVREGTPARMLADWTQNEPNRGLLLRVAEATGMTPAKTLEAVGKDPALFAQDLLRRSAERPQIQDLVREFQIGSLDQTTAVQVGNILRDRLGVFMGEHPAAWHPDEYQANLVKHIFDQSDGWLKTRFDLKPEAGVFRLSGVLKSLQSLVLLGLNPAYFINNAVNNIVTRASQGVFGYMTTKQINDYWTRMGFEPGRLGVGIGAAGEGAISSGLDAVGRLTAGGGFLGKAQKTLGQLNKLGVFSRLSSKFEGFESRQAYTIGAMRFMQRNWKRNIGFNPLDAGLEARLRAVHPQMPEIIYGIVEAGLNPNEITGKILQGAIVRDVSNYIDGAAQRLYPNNPQLAKDLLNTLNISGELSRRLQGATTREAVNRAFADTEAQIQDWIDLRVAQGLADQAGNAEAQVRSAGVAAVLPMFTDMIERNMYGWLTHSNGWQEVFTETANMTPGERGARIQAYSSQTAAEWRRMHSFERQTYQGIHRALGIQDATAAEFMRLMDGEHKLWENFYDGVDVVTNGVTSHTPGTNDLYREFFSRDYESYEARQVAWDTLQQRLNEMYEAAVQRERTIELAMDEEYVGLWERFTGKDASDLLLHRENVRAIRDEMTNAMMAFRQNLRDTNPSVDVRRLMWTEFVENTYRPLIMQLKQTEIIGASRLAGQEPPLINPPTEPGEGAAPPRLDFPPPLEPPSIGQVAAQPIPQTPAQMIRNIAHRYGVPTADVRGRPLDIVIKRIVRKYGGQEFDRIADIPPELAEQAFIARQEADANPVVERGEIDVSDHIDGQRADMLAEAEADIAEARAAGRLNRRMARDLFLSVFDDIPEADVDWIMFMVDQHADTWATEHGYEASPATRDLWWATHLEDVRRIAARPPDNSLTQGSFFEENFENMLHNPEQAQVEVFAPGEGSGKFIRSNTVKIGRDVFEVVLEEWPAGITYFVRKNGAKVLPGETSYLPKTVQDMGSKMVDGENIDRGVQPMLFQQAEAIDTTKFDTWFTYDFLNDRPGTIRSAVVNEDGSPKVVYHGSPRMDFEAFDPEKSKLGLYGKGFYFTEDLEVATGYAKTEAYGDVQRGVIDAHLSIHNPFDIDAVYSFEDAEAIVGHSMRDKYIGNSFTGQAIYDELIFDGSNEFVEIHRGQKTYDTGIEYAKQYADNALMDTGFDGITHIGGRIQGERLHRVWIAFDPRQVKTTNNNGGWSTTDPRMLYQPGTEGEAPPTPQVQQYVPAQPNEPITVEMIEIGGEAAALDGNSQELLSRMDAALETMQKNLKAMPDNDGLAAGIQALQMKRDAIAEGRPYKVVDTKLPEPDVPEVDAKAQLEKAGYTSAETKRMSAAKAKAEADRIFNTEPQPTTQKMKLPDRGGVVFLRDGRAIINAFKGSDASTLIHEIGHIFRRDLAPELLDVVAKSTGLKNGAELSALEEAFWFGEDGKVYQEYQRLVKIEKPTAVERRRITAMENTAAVKNMKRYVVSEEHFASGWERYMAEGVAPTPELRTAFERFSNWLLKIYTRVINTNLDVEVNVKINGVSLKDVYDRLLTVRPPENPSLFGEGATRTVNTTPGVAADASFRELMNGGYHIESVPTEPHWEVMDNQRVLRFADDAIVRIIPDKDGTYSVEGYGGSHKGFTSEAAASLFAQFIAPERIYVLYDPAGTAIKQFVNYDFLASAAGETYGLIKVPNEFVPFAEGVIPAASEKNDYFVYRGMNRGEMDANTLTPDNFRPSPERPVYVVEVLRGRTDYENNRIYTFDAIPVDRIMRVTEIRVQPDGGREYVNVTDIFKDSLDPGRMLFQRATPVFEQVDPFMHGQNQITGRFAVGGTVVAYAPRGMTAPQPMEAGGRTVYLLGIDPDNPALWVAQDGDNIITIPMRDPLNPVPEPSPVGDTQLRNVPTIENEGVALHDLNIDNVMPLMREIKDGVLRDIDSQPLSIGDVSEADQGQVRAWLSRTMGDLASAKLAAAGYGELQRDASLLNYTKRYGADNVTNMFWPYSLWGTRSIQEWAYRMLDKPTLFGLYARYEEMRRKTETEKNGFPSRFKGKMALGLPFLPDYMGQLGFFDPIRQLFPPKAIVGSTLDFLVQEKDRQAGAAVGILYQMVETGEITPAEADEANKTRAGEAWTAAYQRAAEEQDTRFNNPIDVVNNLFSPALWWSIPNNILQGTPEKTNPLPVTRFGQTLQYATQGTWLEGAGAVAGGLLAGPERAIRKKSGLSEFGEWGDYYIDRWLANMAADGTFSTKDVLLAMTERRGPAFDEAYKRAGQEQAFRMPGGVMLYGLTHGMAAKDVGPTVLASLFPLGLFPPGELKQRGLQDDYKKAQDAYYNKGQEDALNQFFKDHPEYEARLALWDKPEERLRQFLVSEIWDAYYKLERPNRSKAVDQLGPTFEKTFLNENTKDYSGLRIDQLAAWAKILKGVVPVVPETKAVDDMGFLLPELDLYPPELAKAIETFQNERDRLYPGWFMLQSAYYNLPNEKRAGYMTRFPLLKKYQDWRKKYEKDHPELKPWFDEQRAKYNTGGTSSGGGGSSGGSTAPQKQPVEKQVLTRSDLRLFSSPLLRQLTSYFLGNVSMGEGAWAELDNIWNKMGRPNGDMNTWLSTVVIQSFQ